VPDFDAILTAVAARYAPGQVTPPTGFDNIRTSTADAPDNLVAPCVIVFPNDGTFDPGNGTRGGHHDCLVRFYFEKAADLPRQMSALRKWLTVLVDQHLTGTYLGGVVAAVWTSKWSVGQLDYGGTSYAGIELTVHFRTAEPWSPTG
jgi:hypothetical protein